MIKCYEYCPYELDSDRRYVSNNDDMINEYSHLCKVYDRIDPGYKLRVQASKMHVWKIEINSIKRLLESPKTNEMEKLLLEDHQNLLQKEAWECSEELQRVFYEEYPQVYPDENTHSQRIAKYYIVEKPVLTRNMDFKKCSQLSPAEKIRLRIAQNGMLHMEQFALGRRRKSPQLAIFEEMFLNYRIYFLYKCVVNNEMYISRIFCEEYPRDSPDIKEIYEEINKTHIAFGNYLIWPNKSNLEYYKYPYDFERPNDVLPIEWGSPDINWKTGSGIPLKDQLKNLHKRQ